MELRHLRYFIAVAEEEHFGRAAVRLRIAQPPLSRQIRQLEDEIGARLFERQGRGVRLTDAGRAFVETARETLASAARGVARALAVSRGEVGRLAVGFVDTSCYAGPPPRVFRQFRAHYPAIALELVQMTSIEQWQALHDDRIQLGFVYHLPEPNDAGTVASRPVHHDGVVLALPRQHRLSRRREIVLADLADEPFIWFPRSITPRYHDMVAAACQAGGLRMKVVQEVRHDATVISLVASGMGVTFAVGAWGKVKPSSVVLKRVRDLDIPLTVSAIWRRDRPRPALASFLGVVDQLVGATTRG